MQFPQCSDSHVLTTEGYLPYREARKKNSGDMILSVWDADGPRRFVSSHIFPHTLPRMWKTGDWGRVGRTPPLFVSFLSFRHPKVAESWAHPVPAKAQWRPRAIMALCYCTQRPDYPSRSSAFPSFWRTRRVLLEGIFRPTTGVWCRCCGEPFFERGRPNPRCWKTGTPPVLV
jgi:hypothetical protein